MAFVVGAVYLDPFPRHLSIQLLPTLCPKVYRYYLHWTIWIRRILFWRKRVQRLEVRAEHGFSWQMLASGKANVSCSLHSLKGVL